MINWSMLFLLIWHNHYLINLEHISVEGCNLVEELFVLQGLAVDERKPTPTFQRLRSLKLDSNNPNLKYLFRKRYVLSFGNLSHYGLKHVLETSENLNKILPSFLIIAVEVAH